MHTFKFDPPYGKNAAIIESVVTSPDFEGAGEDVLFKVRLCVEEIEENILSYSGSTWVEVTTDAADGYGTICFRDGGVPFDPLAKEDPDVNAGLEDRGIGGLGIFLCKQMMDSVDYRYEDGTNVLTMKISIR